MANRKLKVDGESYHWVLGRKYVKIAKPGGRVQVVEPHVLLNCKPEQIGLCDVCRDSDCPAGIGGRSVTPGAVTDYIKAHKADFEARR